MNRRTFLRSVLASVAGSVLLGRADADVGAAVVDSGAAATLPGPFPGRVVEVHHPGCVVNHRVVGEPVRDMVGRGLRELTGAPDATEAWRRFFEPGDVVGIKVNPVGAPDAISSYALVHEVVAGLRSAGIKSQDIVVFDRYRSYLQRAGYPDNVPDGVRCDAVCDDYDPVQLGMAGYDPDVYREIELVSAREQEPTDDRARRSHLALIVSRQVNKIVNLPVLKDHEYAGVTLALKNMSHGFVNNVARSHATNATTACNTFIPAIVSMPAIRSKVVLHVLDGTRAVFDGGPTGTDRTTWTNASLYFATDPVALDHIGWEAIDAKRRAMRLPVVARTLVRHVNEPVRPANGYRQPQHIALAGALGLGVFERARINYHRVVIR